MMNRLTLLKRTLTFVAFIFSIFISFNSLAVECGDIISTPKFLLQDLNCHLSPEKPVALTIEGPSGSLTMGNKQLTCSFNAGEGEVGIALEGFAARLVGGQINDCPNGVIARGRGSHSIIETEIHAALFEGVTLESNNNIVSRSVVLGLGVTQGEGISLDGKNNTATENRVIGVGDEGIEIDGDFATVNFNYVDGNGDDGIDIEALNAIITANFVRGNDEGISIEDDNAVVNSNTVTENGRNGIEIFGASNNLVSNNLVTKNGFVIPGSAGIVILLESDENNEIVGNTSLGNSEVDLKDVFDPDCTGSNVWLDNIFETADPTCLK
ncbi:right-handed parallel beta-helix repeat-containing protein [Microbulbifer sp. MLAF003]|uniref:right-handed parallel beta-helix repeat-containing protein n=2 Tax=Microbulbiferaceae TaxID=1706373 RepID=UPI000A0422AD|nr:right-handed parallel beta-helix repeat-containing protein [Microbulbifer sp. MLAF003]WHI49699.1 right-handed parallel beta-helix repeat-containing protein [Microbulbifer sp. MLAF003]